MLSRHRLAQNYSVPLSLDSHVKSSLLPSQAIVEGNAIFT
jgi:hypothetical protein